MDNHSYTDLLTAAELLWPDNAVAILDAPTDEQVALILAVLSHSPVAVLVS